MPRLLPTHSCFDDSLEFIERRVRADQALAFSGALVLVHGIARYPEDQPNAGVRFAHAWVEETCLSGVTPAPMILCWDAALLETGERVEYAVLRAEYYAHLRVEQTTRYTLLEVWAENQRSGTYGPWNAAYQALCRP